MITSLITVFALVIGIFAILIWLASAGSLIAAFVLGVLTAAVMIFAGSGISLIQAHIAAKKEQENFNANAKENLSIMLAMQKVQNSQNGQLLKQAREMPLIGQNGQPPFDFVDGVFDDLED